MTAARPLPAALLARLRASFGATVAEQMPYDAAVAESIGEHLQASFDGDDILLRFDWCGDNRLVSYDDAELDEVLYDYALHIADDLKEHRGRYGETLPWD